jgi:DNA modification methylase
MNTNLPAPGCAEVITGDALQVLPTLPAGCASLVYLDPPFNIGLDYGAAYNDRQPAAEYLGRLHSLLQACRRVLCPTGTLWLQMGEQYQGEAAVLLKELFHLRQSIVWAYTFGNNQRKRFTPAWQALHYATADRKRLTFNAGPVLVPSWRQLNGDNRACPKGKVMDSFWEMLEDTGELEAVWRIPRIVGNARERVKDANGKSHSCQTPEEVLRWIILPCSNPGELVLDPVCGTGTTLAVAAKYSRRAIGIEVSEQTADLARKRLAAQQTALRAHQDAASPADDG